VDLIRYVVKAVVLEGLSVREVAAAHGVSRSWVYECVARYRAEGEQGLHPRSRRPHSSPARLAAEVEDEIVALRKDLAGQGLDAGPQTIAWHLAQRRDQVPSVATIWRVLSRRGLITPQPQKRPRSSYIRFSADLPNERWQMDITHWQLADGTSVEILNIIDDHSRLLIASAARHVYKAGDVVTVFRQAAELHGLPASVLADNGAVFTAAYRNGVCVMESELLALGISYRHSRPYHPQTCGKVERFHQTLKKWLARQRPVTTARALQAQLDRFAAYYNTCRPHRAIGRRTPVQAYIARIKATPAGPRLPIPPHCRVRHDVIDSGGSVTLRYRSKLYHVGVGRKHAGTKVIIFVADLDIRILSQDGTLIRQLTLDPARNYQPRRLSEQSMMS
jgi:transposase InsO family protein